MRSATVLLLAITACSSTPTGSADSGPQNATPDSGAADSDKVHALPRESTWRGGLFLNFRRLLHDAGHPTPQNQ